MMNLFESDIPVNTPSDLNFGTTLKQLQTDHKNLNQINIAVKHDPKPELSSVISTEKQMSFTNLNQNHIALKSKESSHSPILNKFDDYTQKEKICNLWSIFCCLLPSDESKTSSNKTKDLYSFPHTLKISELYDKKEINLTKSSDKLQIIEPIQHQLVETLITRPISTSTKICDLNNDQNSLSNFETNGISSPISHSEFEINPDEALLSKDWLLGPIDECLVGRKCLVLDLDETLVHSSFKYIHQADFVIPVEIEGNYHNVYVIKRPGVDEFMKRVGELFEVVVFTASVSKYGNPLLDLLDVHHVINHRLFRDSCHNHHGNYIKNLSHLGRPLKNVIIIDNSPTSYIFHLQHAIPVSSWFNDAHDNELLDMLEFLEDMANPEVTDVSLVLDVNI